jgi:acyl dehydratase
MENKDNGFTHIPTSAFLIGTTFESIFSVNDKIYSGFIELFKDENSLHTVVEFAISKGFKSIVMHGNILNGFLSYFIGERLPIKNVIIQSQEINYKKPIYLDDTIILKAIVDEVHDSVNVVIFKYQFFNQVSEIVAKGKIQIGLLK